MTPSLIRRPGGRSRLTRQLALLALPALMLATVVVAPGSVAAQPASQTAQINSEVSVEAAVTEELADDGRTDFWVVFDNQADLSKAHEIDDWAERGQYVYDQLTTTARASQDELTEQLTARGLEFESFWIANAVLVRGGDQTGSTSRTVDGAS